MCHKVTKARLSSDSKKGASLQSASLDRSTHVTKNIMNGTVRTVLAPIAGFLVGGVVNMATIVVGTKLVPAPEGVDVWDPESIAKNIHLFSGKHYAAPFLAHAFGTFAGAVVAYLIASTHKRIASHVVGGLFLLGGIHACMAIPSPAWFVVLDLAGAYVPMAAAATFAGASLLARAALTKKTQ